MLSANNIEQPHACDATTTSASKSCLIVALYFFWLAHAARQADKHRLDVADDKPNDIEDPYMYDPVRISRNAQTPLHTSLVRSSTLDFRCDLFPNPEGGQGLT
jgi:hypothetical protein